MEDMTSQISKILNDPEALEKIKGLSGILNQSDLKGSMPQINQILSSIGTETNKNDTKNNKEKDAFNFNSNSNSSSNTIPEIDPQMMKTFMKIMPLISSMNQDDETAKFLAALRPLLSKKRQKRLDESSKMVKLFKILPLINKEGLF